MPDWLVMDMDDGLLRREPTMRDAREWFRQLVCTAQVLVHRYGPGYYEIEEAETGEATRESAALVRSDRLDDYGRPDGDKMTPLYPLDGDSRFERVERGESQ